MSEKKSELEHLIRGIDEEISDARREIKEAETTVTMRRSDWPNRTSRAQEVDSLNNLGAMNDRRKRLLKLLSDIEQLIAAAEDLTLGVADDALLQRASSHLAELREAWERTQQLVNQPEGEH